MEHQINFTNESAPATHNVGSDLKILSDITLIESFGKLVQTERKITRQVLAYISEIDVRQIYLARAYKSLFDYLVNEFGYSAGAAMRRIDGARLLQEIPEVATSLECGSLNLSQMNQLQRVAREVRKTSHAPLSTDTKKDLLKKMENLNQKDSERLIASELSLPMITFEKQRTHRDDSVTLTMTFTAEQFELLQQVQNAAAHCVPDNNWSLLISYLAQKEMKRRNGGHKIKEGNLNQAGSRDIESKLNMKSDNCQSSSASVVSSAPHAMELTSFAKQATSVTAATAMKLYSVSSIKVTNSKFGEDSSRSRHATVFSPRKPISRPVKRQLLTPGAQCEFIDEISGKKCGSQKFLQIDHRLSVSRGGDNSPANLQVLCGSHNRYKYKCESM